MLETYKNSSENVPSRKVDDLIQRISVLEDVLCAAKEVLTTGLQEVLRKNRAISQEEVNEHAHQVLQKMAMG